MSAEQLPPPPDVLRRQPRDVVLHSGLVWRVHHESSAPGRAWDRLRHFGPLSDQRFDPHGGACGPAKPEGVQYAAGNPIAAIGEVFPAGGIPTGDPAQVLYGWRPVRPLRLLDLRHTFGVRNGGTASFSTWPDKRRTRQWARAIDAQYPDVDGLLSASKVTGYPAITLLTAAEPDPPWPAAPHFAREFTSAALRPLLLLAAEELGAVLLP